MRFWAVSCEWSRETVFVVAGGSSVQALDLERLRGRKIIVINSSLYAVPWADILYFGDFRWWNEHQAAVGAFSGRIVTTATAVRNEQVLVCRKTNPPGLARERDSLMQKWTSLTAATNLAAHLVGPGGTIVWLGADGKPGADGRVWHHEAHRWPPLPQRWDRHRADLASIRGSLVEFGITLRNVGVDSAYADLWPMTRFEDVLDERRAA